MSDTLEATEMVTWALKSIHGVLIPAKSLTRLFAIVQTPAVGELKFFVHCNF